jgi:DNA-binding NtrC family response regulator
MQLRARLEILINEMLDGQILLDEARAEFEKLYIQKALDRYDNHLSKTANALGVHRNTLSKKVSTFQDPVKISRRLLMRRAR